MAVNRNVCSSNVLITEPDFLMLDEPTNHLDLEMIEWLQGYLNRGNKTIFMVTHDRFFLDKVCNTILELDDQTIYTYRAITPIILRSDRSAWTISVPRFSTVRISIVGSWTGCADSLRLVVIRRDTVRSLL